MTTGCSLASGRGCRAPRARRRAQSCSRPRALAVSLRTRPRDEMDSAPGGAALPPLPAPPEPPATPGPEPCDPLEPSPAPLSV
uniref:SFRICE_005284 n=1 Tax=Spodoptera frugiperda TaxID=7108 RepID=A0A2H1VH78_SPOFR